MIKVSNLSKNYFLGKNLFALYHEHNVNLKKIVFKIHRTFVEMI